MGELMLATVRAVGDGVHGYVNGGWRVSYAVVCRFRYFSKSTLIQTAISYLSRTRFILYLSLSFTPSKNTLSVKLYQSVPSPMIIISTFRPTHQIKTNGTERKLKVSGRKSRLLFPSGPTPTKHSIQCQPATAPLLESRPTCTR